MYDLYICNPIYKYKKQLTQKVFFIYLILGLPQNKRIAPNRHARGSVHAGATITDGFALKRERRWMEVLGRP